MLAFTFPTCRNPITMACLVLAACWLFVASLYVASAGFRVQPEMPLAVMLTLTSTFILALLIEVVACASGWPKRAMSFTS